MKKLLLFAVIIFVGAAVTSCKKEYTCVCGTTETKAEFRRRAQAVAWCEFSSADFCVLK
jgi:hypothetical protein